MLPNLRIESATIRMPGGRTPDKATGSGSYTGKGTEMRWDYEHEIFEWFSNGLKPIRVVCWFDDIQELLANVPSSEEKNR